MTGPIKLTQSYSQEQITKWAEEVRQAELLLDEDVRSALEVLEDALRRARQKQCYNAIRARDLPPFLMED